MFFFFFNDTATTEIYTLSLHDALPICRTLHPQYLCLQEDLCSADGQVLPASPALLIVPRCTCTALPAAGLAPPRPDRGDKASIVEVNILNNEFRDSNELFD